MNEQPAPTPNARRPVWELVIEDMHSRDRTGRTRYGTPLQAFNGRQALQDAYEEALDLAVYLRQAIEEREWTDKQMANLREANKDLDEALRMARIRAREVPFV